jgi:hypothetical protein
MSRFDAIWVPRIGAEAARLLRKRAWLALGRLALLVFIVVMAVARVDAYYAVVAPVAAAYLCVDFWLLRWLNRQIAAAASSHLGVEIPRGRLPSTRSAAQFDRAIEILKGTATGHETSLLRGFIKIRRP